MGDVIQFPGGEEPDNSDILHTLIYKLWMSEFHDMFVEGNKRDRELLIYGHFAHTLFELEAEEAVEIIEENDHYGLAIDDVIRQLVWETVIAAFNNCKEDYTEPSEEIH